LIALAEPMLADVSVAAPGVGAFGLGAVGADCTLRDGCLVVLIPVDDVSADPLGELAAKLNIASETPDTQSKTPSKFRK
jgi:hypothetical protein